MDDDLGADWPSEDDVAEEPPLDEDKATTIGDDPTSDEAHVSEASDEKEPTSDEAQVSEASDEDEDAEDDDGEEDEVQEGEANSSEPAAEEADLIDGVSNVEPTNLGSWTLPIRAAPILALQGEDVVEFPLSQHVSGYESTSVVMDDELMRIVEARYDPDGVRRLSVRMVLVKEHISGYSHTHLDLFAKLQPVWWGSLGFGLFLATTIAQGLLALGGAAFILAGLAGMLMARLDLHRISFSDHGGRHDFYLSGWRQEPYLIHNSTALLGPAIVDFLRSGELTLEHIDAVVKSMGNPRQPERALTQPPKPTVVTALAEPTPFVSQEPQDHPLGPPTSSEPSFNGEAPPSSAASPIDEQAMFPPPPPGPPVMEPIPPPPSGPPVAQSVRALPPPPPPPVAEPMPALPPPPAPPVTLPPAPLPPAPLPPPPMMANVDEDALWDDLT